MGWWLRGLSEERKKEVYALIVKDLTEGGLIFGSKVVREFPLEDFAEAVKVSSEVASEGKVLLRPHI